MKNLIFLILLFSCFISLAQPPWRGDLHEATTNSVGMLSYTGTSGTPTVIAPTTTPVTAAQWHYAGKQNTISYSSSTSRDWVYSIVSTNKKEYVACGYARAANYDAHQSGIIFKLDHYGNLVWSRPINTTWSTLATYNFLWQITKAGNEYVAVGSCGPGGSSDHMIVIVDDDGNFKYGTPYVFQIPVTTPDLMSSSLSSASVDWANTAKIQQRAYSVAIDPTTNSATNLIIGGEYTFIDHTSGITYNMASIFTLNYTTSGLGGTWSVGKRYIGGNNNGVASKGGNRILTLLTKVRTGGYDIYGCGAISASNDHINYSTTNLLGSTTMSTFDKDIWLVKLPNNFSSVTFDNSFNKTNIRLDGASGSGPFISTVNSTTYPHDETGPLSARNYNSSGYIQDVFAGVTGLSPAAGTYYSPATYYLNANNNENEEAHDMVFTADGNIAITGVVNVIGANKANNGNTRGIEAFGSFGSGYYEGTALGYGKEYQDGDAFLLKVNTSGTLLAAKNVGHFSGLNFNVCIKQDLENNYIIAGSTADKYGGTDYNLPDPKVYGANALIVYTDDAFPGTLYKRRSFVASDSRSVTESNKEETNCVFGLDLTADGGYVIGGNNEINGDDHTITKFAPFHQTVMVGNGSFYDFSLGYIPTTYTVGSSETWSTSRNIASKIVIPSGHTLNITAGTYSFASSNHLWDYTQTPDISAGGDMGCGIIVEPGGILNVTNATLQGISITGEHNVWDGIVVQGTPASASASVQGQVNLSGATIKDARYGLYVADIYRAYKRVSLGVTDHDHIGCTYSSRYDGTSNKGGGIVTAYDYGTTHTTFLNCMSGAAFTTYGHPNLSSFTECNFNSDATGIGDICFYTDATGQLLPSSYHIGAFGWKSLTIKDNVFTCNTAFPLGIRPYGIFGFVSGLNITNTTSGPGNAFSNLSYGVYHGSFIYGGAPLTVTNNTFDNNSYGLFASGATYGLIIKGNHFGVPHYSGYNATGITIAGCRGYYLGNNTFEKSSTTSLPYYGDIGITVNNGNIINESVNNNTFGYIAQANIPLQMNGDASTTGTTGLQYRCNTFQNSYQDIRANSYTYSYITVPATLRRTQGHASPIAARGAGNRFFPACTWSGSSERLGADGAMTQVVTYYNNFYHSAFDPYPCYSDNTSTSFPGIFDNISNILSGTPPTYADACPEVDYTDPSMMPEWGGTLETLDAAISAEEDPDEIAELQLEHDMVLAAMVRAHSTNGDYDDAAALLAGYNMYRDALYFYFAAGDYQNASTMYQNLPLTTDDDKLFAWEAGLAINLYNNGDTWYDLDSTSKDSLAKIVQYNKPAGYMAGGIAAFLGIVPVKVPEPIIDTAALDTAMVILDSLNGGNKIGHNEGHTSISDNFAFSAFPNPTYGSLTVSASMSGKLVLFNLLGQELKEYTIPLGKVDLKMPPNLAAGIYIGKFRSDNGKINEEVKLAYQP